ncbi:hypothetical protein HLB23_39415 [Nocardia uniformis]|uniref:Uncharacterized protein n=1 Tax=Nocardia uniformis TaxID=53432 RepID=A0A849CGN6_9NOCA|nr:hypothetical protein [Nocardia uniformis]NNH75857.1 hypothetical protein [Nocardia uniformis]
MKDNHRPLVVFVDTTGGEDPSRIARRLTDALARSGVRPDRIALWQRVDSSHLRATPPEEFRAELERLLNRGDQQ